MKYEWAMKPIIFHAILDMKSDSCKPLLLHSLPPLEKIMLVTFCMLFLCSQKNVDIEYFWASGDVGENRDAKFNLVLKISQLTYF